MEQFVLILALFWGFVLAGFLQFVPIGRFLAKRRTWITVVVGIGLDLVLGYLMLPWEAWLAMVEIVALSSVGIIVRSLYNEWAEWKALLKGNGNGQETATLE